MSVQRKTVFVSCGQYTSEEKQLGKQVCELVAKHTPFEGYFADNQTTLKALSENVLRRLYDSVGLIVIMHHRGKIEGRDTIRASVWIEQEIAMAAMMEQILGRPLYVVVFTQPGITREGMRSQLQLNVVEFNTAEEIIARLSEILPKWKEPLYIGDDERKMVANRVMLTIKTENTNDRNYTIRVKNHSEHDVEINSVSLFSKGQRISEPAFPTSGIRWSVPAGRDVPIGFNTEERAAYRLWQIEGTPPRDIRMTLNSLPGQFNAEIRVVLSGEVLGVERDFEDTRMVQVDSLNWQITGL
jgi:hypothetical protein